jgi:hypothetical protein
MSLCNSVYVKIGTLIIGTWIDDKEFGTGTFVCSDASPEMARTTCRAELTMSVDGGKAEVGGKQSNRRD